MAYSEGQNDQLAVFQFADHAIIPDAVPPESSEFAGQRFPECARVGTLRNFFLKNPRDLIGCLLIEFS
jgi:hypothetical protein